MAQRSKIWRFSGVLRGIALVLAAINALAIVSAWIAVCFGDTELFFIFADIDHLTAPLELWQILLGGVFMLVDTIGIILLCLAINQFLKTSKRAGFFMQGVITACRKLAYGLMIYWLGFVFTKNLMPWVLTYNFPEGERMEMKWVGLNFYMILLVGIILLLIAQALDEARVIDSDNKQFI